MNLKQLLNSVEEQNLHILNIVIRQNDEITAEHHFTEEKRVHLWSVSKTFTSMAIGIAANEGYFKLDDKISHYFDIPTNSMWDQVTIHDLLCMGSGQKKCPFAQALDEGRSLDNVEELFFSEPVINKPGTHFLYSNASTYMLSKLISLCTGNCLNDYLSSRLFEPLGIPAVEWETDINGVTMGCAGLRLSAHEVSKAGQLLLNEGKWGDSILIPPEYVRKATRKQIDTSGFNESFATADHRSGYGYQVWMNSYAGSYRLDGLYGQYIVIIPKKKAVITFISNEPTNMTGILELTWKYIIGQA